MIAQITGENQTRWDDQLPELMLAFNSSISETTKYCPAQLILGRELRLPGTVFDKATKGSGIQKETVEDRWKRMEEQRIDLSLRNMIGAEEQQKTRYDLRKREWKPKVGDSVLCKTHHLSNAVQKFNAKLAPRYDGPWEVAGFVSPVILTLKNKRTRKIRRAHIGDTKPYVELSHDP
ncbi:hypothetical protein KR032_002662, partial [Drosophila birchii]